MNPVKILNTMVLLSLLGCAATGVEKGTEEIPPVPNLPDVDDDGDGYSELEGDCDDTENLVSPDSIEITETLTGEAEGVDNNCNGEIDEYQACDSSLDDDDSNDYAKAMGACGDYLKGTEMTTPFALWNSPRAIEQSFGNNFPREGQQMAILSTGKAKEDASKRTGHEYGFAGDTEHPFPQPAPNDSCGIADPTAVSDLTSFKLELVVPRNAQAFAFDFSFFTAEYPHFVCKEFDDTFLALLDTGDGVKRNISFDENGNPATVNAGFFDVCKVSDDDPRCKGTEELQGLNFATDEGGATGWLSTIAPVSPGASITLEFFIFDEGDAILDSFVLLDHFRWLAEPVDGPVTID